MEYEYNDKKIIFNKQLSDLDNAVIKFVKILNELKINYVIISGYVAILFGRSRATEDVDFFIEPVSKEKFKVFSDLIAKEYWFLNSSDEEELFSMLVDDLSIRIAESDKVVPNFEVKFAIKQHEKESLQSRIEVVVNGNSLLISPLESQIPYKFKLGSKKDIEDALHLYEIFGKHLNRQLMMLEAKKHRVYEEMIKNGINI